ncbi:L-aspartate oxidase [Helicobacter sp. TUL]|uniref:L-aspartate oxidase n=1 Tax=Helicobacter sp. TUL TaxID=1848928 RepID=UPI000BABA8B6|nr:L-aspartate oxidase [Helicobacter sp. TUL]PAU99396.1 L-aspartate oxidase [Helicobacter sp. TUL]
MERLHYDVVIVGAGVAGLYCARHLPKNLRVLLLCKNQSWECNTFYAQGGITIARDQADIPLHVKDTILAGSQLNDVKSVERLSTESLEILQELLNDGFGLDRDEKGALSYTKEGGHSIARIVHSGGDGTGRNLHTFLMHSLGHTLWKSARVIDLLLEDDRCYGVSVQTKKGLVHIYSDHVVLASGGVGGLFKYHTNAHTIGGDVHGIILEHGLKLAHMEMLQFHPSVYVQTKTARKYLISEAVRGEGGKVIDSNGKRFLFEYDPRGELAPRDIVARAIVDYCQKYNQEAFLDLRAFSKQSFAQRFPNIYRELSACKLDIPNDLVPISPAFHYCMGGILCDDTTRVQGMTNLYAIGECAYNGVHGANRLASNSLLEGLVFGKIAAREILNAMYASPMRYFPFDESVLEKEGDAHLRDVLRKIMWEKVGIVRSKDKLNAALGGIEALLESNIGRMLKLRLLVAQNIVQSALAREKSLGAHYIV